LVESNPELQIDIDGESGVKAPFEVSVAPKAIKIIAKKYDTKKINQY
jgi:diacylglycerol kinase family enzyme